MKLEGSAGCIGPVLMIFVVGFFSAYNKARVSSLFAIHFEAHLEAICINV